MTFKPPHPGELNLLASVQEFIETGVDANGQPTGTWEEITTEYVKREGLSGRVLEIARQLVETATHNIYLRYNYDVTRSVRFVIDGVAYAVGWVDNEGIEWMRCTCEELWPRVSERPAGQTGAALLKDDGFYLLNENGGKLLLG